MALEATTVPEVLQRAAIEGRLSVDEWPDRPLVITAVEAVTGELARFDRDSGVPLVDAAAATSTAGSARSPTPIWPRG